MPALTFTDEQRAMMRTHLLECLDAIRSNKEIAEHCGIKRQNIDQWVRKGMVSGGCVNGLVELAAKHRFVAYPWKLRPDLHKEPVAAKGSRK